ncbi:MAG: hypothetical protein EAY81_04735 [Bacteroidetes bacterium]|nr:MAG: hypothetical protein EAY81_04735 [Bacteroidota bacterium]
MKKTLAFILLLTIVSTSGCLKKGEDDPFISFRTRKARVAGKWKVTSYKFTEVYTSSINPSSNYTDVLTSDGFNYTLVSTENGSSSSKSGIRTEKWEFEKNGDYKSTLVFDGVLFDSKGTWNFTGGIGDKKNKSQIAFVRETYTSTNGLNTYTGSNIDQVYDIKELRDKRMVWTYQYTAKNSNTYIDTKIEIELEAD